MSLPKGRRKPHSNRWKKFRKISEMMAKVPNSLRAIERQVYMSVYETTNDKDGIEHRVKVKPNATKERNKYARHVVMIRKLQAFWIYQCPRRIYKDMKRAGI